MLAFGALTGELSLVAVLTEPSLGAVLTEPGVDPPLDICYYEVFVRR